MMSLLSVFNVSTSSFKSDSDQSRKSKKKITRKSRHDVSSQEALRIAGWEAINSMYKGKLLTFMYQVYKSELPGNIIRLFKSSNCCYDLRNSIKYQVPQFHQEVGRNSLRYRGALFWNSIGYNLKRAPSRNIFKKLLKKNRPLFDNINFNTEMK